MFLEIVIKKYIFLIWYLKWKTPAALIDLDIQEKQFIQQEKNVHYDFSIQNVTFIKGSKGER